MRRSLNPQAMGWGFIFVAVGAIAFTVGYVYLYILWHFISKFW